MQGMTPSARQRYLMEREQREREALERYQREAPRRAAACRTMAFWNAALAGGWRSMFWPTVGAALRSECFFLHVVCPACQQLGELDLRTIDIHPNATLSVVVRRLSCQRCCPHPPFARPLGATRRSWLDERKWYWRPTPAPKVTFPVRNAGPGWAQTRLRDLAKKKKT
jgi:hypothetical protein